MATKCACTGIDVLIRDVRVVVPGVTDAVVAMELYNTLKEFCQRSMVVRAETQDVLMAGQQDFVLADVEGWEVIYVVSLRHEEGWLRPRPQLRQMRSLAAQSGYWCDPPNHVHFSAPFDKETAIDGIVALGPGPSCAQNCQMVPKIIWDRHYEAIRAGTMGRLYIQPSKPYSNLGTGRMMLQRAHALTGEARVTADKESTVADPPWAFPRWAP